MTSVLSGPRGDDSPTGRKRCDAKTKRGGRCRKGAGYGTRHLGYGTCKFHGGSTPASTKGAIREMAREWSKLEGVKKSPEETMRHVLALANGEVEFFQRALDDAEPHTDEWRSMLKERERAYTKAFDFAAATLTAGLDVRRTEMAERLGELWGSAMQALLADLALSPDQRSRVPELFDHHMGKVGARVIELEEGTNGAR